MTPYLANSTSFSSFGVRDALLPSFLVSAYKPALHRWYGQESLAVRNVVNRQHPRGSFARSARGSSLRQLRVSDAFASHTIHERIETLQSVTRHIPCVEANRKLIDIAVQMLLARLVIDAVQSTLEHSPHGFDSVGACHAAHVLVRRMVDALLLVEESGQVVVGRVLIGVERGTDFHIRVNRVLNFLLRCGEQWQGLDLASTLTHSEDGHLADRAASEFLLVCFVLVALQSADESLINLDGAAQFVEVFANCLAQAMQDEPRRLLSYAYLFCQLHRRDALASRNEQVHRIEPLMQRHMAALKDGSRSHREVQFASVATVIAGSVLHRCDACAALALWADDAVWPKPRFQVLASRGFVREKLEQFEGADSRARHLCLQNPHSFFNFGHAVIHHHDDAHQVAIGRHIYPAVANCIGREQFLYLRRQLRVVCARNSQLALIVEQARFPRFAHGSHGSPIDAVFPAQSRVCIDILALCLILTLGDFARCDLRLDGARKFVAQVGKDCLHCLLLCPVGQCVDLLQGHPSLQARDPVGAVSSSLIYSETPIGIEVSVCVTLNFLRHVVPSMLTLYITHPCVSSTK